MGITGRKRPRGMGEWGMIRVFDDDPPGLAVLRGYCCCCGVSSFCITVCIPTGRLSNRMVDPVELEGIESTQKPCLNTRK